MVDMTTLAEHVSGLDDELSEIINEVVGLTDTICAELPHRRGLAGSENIYGEEQMALDVWTNNQIIEKLRTLPQVRAAISEEEDEAVILNESGSYTVTMDPLDGSSNIKSNNCFGTIIGVHKEKDLLAEGRKQVAAFYNLYGPINTLVYSAGSGVHEFVEGRKENKGQFILSRENMVLPGEGKLLGPGGAVKKWPEWVTDFVRELFEEGKKLRYGGAFVGDFNQVLIYGGLFFYPELEDKPEGKLRLVIECNPMSYIMEAAGGASSNGVKSILELKPTHIDQRTPVYVGNKDLVDRLEKQKK